MLSTARRASDAALLTAADVACHSGTKTGAKVATTLDHVRTNQVAPVIIVVVAVATFLALALVIGAIAAYIYYCQRNGGKWPGLVVPSAKNGFYALTCVKV